MTVTGYTGVSLVDATCVLRVLDDETWRLSDATEADAEYDGTVSIDEEDEETITLAADITDTESALLTKDEYHFEFVVTTAGASVFVLATGTLTVHKEVETPAA